MAMAAMVKSTADSSNGLVIVEICLTSSACGARPSEAVIQAVMQIEATSLQRAQMAHSLMTVQPGSAPMRSAAAVMPLLNTL